MWHALLAQQAAAPNPADQPWWYLLLDNALGIAILAVFITAVVAMILQQRRRDKCLKLFRKYTVTFLSTAQPEPMWGKLHVFPESIELEFDAPYVNRRGVVKSSSLIYKEELDKGLALLRPRQAQDDKHQRKRLKQVKRRFRPWFHRRAWRWVRNLFNSLRDAFSKSLTLLIGQLAKARPQSQVLAQQQGSVEQIGQTILGVAGNMHEPILERHIGKPVVLTLPTPAGGEIKAIEVTGFLADYSDKYIAVMSLEQPVLERVELSVAETLQRDDITVELTDGRVRVKALGPELLVVRSIDTGEAIYELNAVLAPGGTLSLPDEGPNPTKVVLERTRSVDIVAPRALARVYFGAETQQRRSWLRGLAPVQLLWGAERDEAPKVATDTPPTPTESRGEAAETARP